VVVAVIPDVVALTEIGGDSLSASAITICGTTTSPASFADGADVKTVQARLRHASAKTTLDTYGHIWPDRDESTRAAVDAVLTIYRTEQRPGGP
jgi:hypothetical protein